MVFYFITVDCKEISGGPGSCILSLIWSWAEGGGEERLIIHKRHSPEKATLHIWTRHGRLCVWGGALPVLSQECWGAGLLFQSWVKNAVGGGDCSSSPKSRMLGRGLLFQSWVQNALSSLSSVSAVLVKRPLWMVDEDDRGSFFLPLFFPSCRCRVKKRPFVKDWNSRCRSDTILNHSGEESFILN